MTPRKDSRSDLADLYPNDTDPAIVNMLARGNEPKPRTDDEKIHIFWRVFGGAIVSVVALSGLTLYNNLQSSVIELRSEMAKINELRGDLVRKDEFNSRISSNYERISTVQTQSVAFTSSLATLKADIDGNKERLTLLQTDLKLARDDANKTKLDIEKNQAADQERKLRRDEQYRDVERLIKEFQTALQDCQVKLARLEGQQSKPKDPPTKE